MDTRTTSGQFDQVKASRDLSQLIRSNTPQYWNYMRRRADLSSLKRYLPFEGLLAGDPHMGNFSVLPLKQVGGSRQMRFVDIDFDDAGHGPFVLDFVRYLIASKSIRKQIKKRPLEKSYLAGLAGKQLKPPKKVQSLLAMPVAKYDAMVADYAKKNSSKTDSNSRRERSSLTPQRSLDRQSKACSPLGKSSIWQSGTKDVAAA